MENTMRSRAGQNKARGALRSSSFVRN